MKIDMKWLDDNGACSESKQEWTDKKMKPVEGVTLIKKLMKADKFQWANWLIVRLMTHEQKIQYAIFAAEQVIEIYEKKYPDDKRPRNAIKAAKEYIKAPTEKNKNAADAAYAAAHATHAAYAAADAAHAAARTEMQNRIIENGIGILKQTGNREESNEN